MRRWSRFHFLFVSCVVVVGCGGGGGSSSSVGGSEFAFGNLSGRAASTNPPVTTNSALVTATGFTGGITSLNLRDQIVTANEARILFASERDGDFEVYAMGADGNRLEQLTTDPAEDTSPCVSPDGRKIVFVSARTGSRHVFIMNLDGTSQTQLTNSAGTETQPVWSPDGTEIVYVSDRDGNDEIYKINVATTVETRLTNDLASDRCPSWTPDGKIVVFQSDVNSLLTKTDLFRVKSDGTGRALVYSSPDFDENCSVGPDGNVYFDSGNQIWQTGVFVPAAKQITTGTDARLSPQLSSDRTRIVFQKTPFGSAFGSVCSLNAKTGGDERQISDGQNDVAPTWASVPKDRTLIGTGGFFGTSASGMIFSQKHTDIASVLCFGATTPSSAIVTQQTGLNSTGPNLTFSLDADVVTYLTYASSPSYKATKVVGPGLSVVTASGALVSLDSDTGLVVAVIPFTGSRGTSRSVTEENGVRIYRGEFLGAFNSAGENVAPGGTREVRLDLVTGKLTVQ